MKTFKEFIEKPKEEYIFNSHGAHAYSNNSSCSDIKENIRTSNNGSYEDNYQSKNDNAHHLGFSKENHEEGEHAKQMDNLHEKSKPNTEEGKRALYKFTTTSTAFTDNLLNHHVRNQSLSEATKELHNKLKAHAFQPSPHDLQSYSGVGFNIHNVRPSGKSKQGNNTYYQPTYMSSSIRKKVAHRFAGRSAAENHDYNLHIFHWHHNKGQSVGIVGKDSRFTHEHEVLVPPTMNTGHHIELLKTEKYRDNENRNVYVHHVRRIPESEVIKGK